MPLQATSGAASYDAFGGGVAAVPNYIEDVFSTYLYTGNGSTQTITNGIDLSTKGGMVWIKSRQLSYNHELYDTLRGPTWRLSSNSTVQSNDNTTGLTAFNSNGFTLGASSPVNYPAYPVVSWTFRKQPKFFDVVTYTGNSTAGQQIAHNLGSTPGFIIVKATNNGSDWFCYHTSLGATKRILLNTTGASATDANAWNNTAPTSTVFTLGAGADVNYTGITYVAYLFAHDAGGFGLTGTDNVISCGSYTGNGSATGPSINLGYEPQWLLVKSSTQAYNWLLIDTMRGMPVGGSNAQLEVNNSNAEAAGGTYFSPTATGFNLTSTSAQVNQSGATYIYIAIRRGPMKVPTSGTSVFAVDQGDSSTTNPQFRSNFVTDLGLFRSTLVGNNWETSSRLQGSRYLRTNTTDAEAADADIKWDFVNGFYGPVRNSNFYAWMFKRAPSFFDEVCYTGNAIASRSLSHNLGVAPELAIFKIRSAAGSNWVVFQKDVCVTGNDTLSLNTTGAVTNTGNYFPNGFALSVTSTTLNDIGSSGAINGNGATFVAYLFATCAGVSKCFSYTGNGSTQTINCGFTAGARWILIKRTDSTGDWYVWDSARGIVSGNDPHLSLNTTAAEVTTDDTIDTDSTGFVVNQVSATNVNVSSATYIGIAIA